MTDISVIQTGPDQYTVQVSDSHSTTMHLVRVTDLDAVRIAPGVGTAELVEESFRFLLEREAKESILRSFDLPVIGRYFPEYEAEIRGRFS